MDASGRFSICVLLYGDFPRLAERCLSSIRERAAPGRRRIFDFRLGLNEISAATRAVVDGFVADIHSRTQRPVISYDCPRNALKYPLMRRMLLADPVAPAEFVMWFDDDSYLCGNDDWWEGVAAAAAGVDMLGRQYRQPVDDVRWEWVRRQPWFNPSVGEPRPFRFRRTRAFRFCTGGWWVARSELFRKFDWPCPELRHCGGDSMFGELLRHQGRTLGEFDHGVRINADDRGRHSSAPRRGFAEPPLGASPPRDRDYEEFPMVRRCVGSYA